MLKDCSDFYKYLVTILVERRIKINSFISWIGGKKALREKIYEMFPQEYSVYVEVFGGGGWVLFGKRQSSNCKEVYNDFNGNLVNLFRCVKEEPISFINELGFLPLTSRDEFKVLKKFMQKERFSDEYMFEQLELAQKYMQEPYVQEIQSIYDKRKEHYYLERATVFFKLIKYSYASGTKAFGCQPYDIRKCFKTLWEASERLRNVVVENKSFEQIIPQYDCEQSFTYCDPPYYGTEDLYEVGFSKDNHILLRDTLKKAKGKWMVSYNDCEYIRGLYKDYYITSVERMHNMAQRYDGGKIYKEVIITNYDPEEVIRKRRNLQQTLYDFTFDEEENIYND